MTTSSRIINFANEKFCTIKCSAPSTDSYEVTNLINEESSTKRKGFLSYSAIRPPIDIDLDIICPVHLHYISINAGVGSQRCTALEILGKSSHLEEFQSMSLAYFTEPGLLLCNGRIYSKDNLPDGYSNYCIRYFKSKMFRMFMNASHIRIKILRTENSVPCLGGVEIVGHVSRASSESVKSKINAIVSRGSASKRYLENCEESPTKIRRIELPDTFEIPDEFKDALTYEVMAIPITLPSGNTIDQSTLEKYINIEASFGRKPSDPFTGVKFSDERKPAFNIALKNRIDLFLICNSHKTETYTIQRTVGKSLPATNVIPTLKSSTELPKKSKNSDDDTQVGSETSSLDDAIRKAMSSNKFVSFTKEVQENATPTDTKGCEICKICDNLYKITCGHVYCKHCLYKECLDSLKCFTCNKNFVKQSVKRHHCS